MAAGLASAPEDPQLQQRALLLLTALNVAIRSAPNRDTLAGAHGGGASVAAGSLDR